MQVRPRDLHLRGKALTHVKIDGILPKVKKVAPRPPIVLSETDRRELCPLHGWVGRSAFQRDHHDLCEDPAEELPSTDDDDEDDALAARPQDKGRTKSPRQDRSSPRRRGVPPKKTIAVRRITQLELQAGRDELAELGAEADVPHERPRTRGDCSHVPRPCPYVGCSKNLYLDVSESGSIILNFPHLEPGQMAADQSCALDLTNRGGMTLEEIAIVMNLTRERVRQIEVRALLRRARPAATALGLGAEDTATVDASDDNELPRAVATILLADRLGKTSK
jgi:hypothetical protein